MPSRRRMRTAQPPWPRLTRPQTASKPRQSITTPPPTLPVAETPNPIQRMLSTTGTKTTGPINLSSKRPTPFGEERRVWSDSGAGSRGWSGFGRKNETKTKPSATARVSHAEASGACITSMMPPATSAPTPQASNRPRPWRRVFAWIASAAATASSRAATRTPPGPSRTMVAPATPPRMAHVDVLISGGGSRGSFMARF